MSKLKNKKDVIELILRISCLSEREKSDLADLISTSDLGDDQMETLIELVEKFQKDCKKVEQDKKIKVSAINEKYAQKIKTYLHKKKAKILNLREREDQKGDENNISNIFKELENVSGS